MISAYALVIGQQASFLVSQALLHRTPKLIQYVMNPLKTVNLVQRRMLKLLFWFSGQGVVQLERSLALAHVGLDLYLPQSDLPLVLGEGP